MRLIALEPRWLGKPYFDEQQERQNNRIVAFSSAEASGIEFLCPLCFESKGENHSVICWDGTVPGYFGPAPGRWDRQGDGFEDLTLVGAGDQSDSVLLTTKGGCQAHLFVRGGEIVFC